MKYPTNKNKLIILAAIIIAVLLFMLFSGSSENAVQEQITEIKPYIGDISVSVSTTGTVAPKNRLEIMPSVAGRIDSILVKEGDYVRVGQVLVLMSSTERAALIDAARLQGSAALKYWQDTYKPIQIVAPIQGTIIVRNAEPGQTVSSNPILVISDRLIVNAQVDETDIGRVRVGETAITTLDAHPEINISGKVSHIYYESMTVNNVTVYYVEIMPDKVPPEFRSGMNASIEIIQAERKNVLIVPSEAVMEEDGQAYIMVKTNDKTRPEKRAVKTGMVTSDKIEITEGLEESETLLVFGGISETRSEAPKNPLMPQMQRGRR